MEKQKEYWQTIYYRCIHTDTNSSERKHNLKLIITVCLWGRKSKEGRFLLYASTVEFEPWESSAYFKMNILN